MRSLLAGVFLCAGSVVLHAQVYTFTEQVFGYQEIALSDAGNQSAPYSGTPAYASALVNFGTLRETIYLNQAAQTIRQVGSLTLSSPTVNLSFMSFGSGPTLTPATINATLTLAGGGPLTFDTGLVSYSWNKGTFDSQTPLTLGITGSYSLTTGGQTYMGNLQYSQIETVWTTTFGALTSTSMSVTQNASSSEMGSVLASVTAADGYSMRLENGSDDGTSYLSYNMGSVIAESTPSPVPEPSTAWILAVGLIALFIRRAVPVRVLAKAKVTKKF